jgi:hypothetical protein
MGCLGTKTPIWLKLHEAERDERLESDLRLGDWLSVAGKVPGVSLEKNTRPTDNRGPNSWVHRPSRNPVELALRRL